MQRKKSIFEALLLFFVIKVSFEKLKSIIYRCEENYCNLLHAFELLHLEIRQRIHQSILNVTSTSTQSSSKYVLVTNPPVHFGFFLWTGQSTSPVQNTFWFLTLDKWNVGIFNGFALYHCKEMFLKTSWEFKTGRKFEFK